MSTATLSSTHCPPPAPLAPEAPPTVAALIAGIEHWVAYELRAALAGAGTGVGIAPLLAKYLDCIFPADRRFMVGPHYAPPRAAGATQAGAGGRERERISDAAPPVLAADLAVVKDPTAPRAAGVVAVLNVKHDAEPVPRAEERLLRGMARIADTQKGAFRGFLVARSAVRVYELRGGAGAECVREYDMLDAGNPFTEDLARIAVAHWN